MLQLEWPQVLLLMPLPLLAYWLLPPRALAEQAALRVPDLGVFELGGARASVARPRRWPVWLAALAWALAVIAAGRPQWLGDAVSIPVSGRDLMLAVDLSDSMRTGDFELENRQVNRLTASRAVATDFIERRRGDRIGLILFGTRAYLQTPLTFDVDTVRRLLDEAAIGLAGERTAIGDAIGLAVKRLEDSGNSNRVLILMTDGANTAGEVAPIRAAELAAARGLRIYTIGIGADEEFDNSWLGLRRSNPSSQPDEATLRAIAAATGGRYFRARDSDELAEIYAELDALEPLPSDAERLRPIRPLFVYPLAGALTLAGLMLALTLWRRW